MYTLISLYDHSDILNCATNVWINNLSIEIWDKYLWTTYIILPHVKETMYLLSIQVGSLLKGQFVKLIEPLLYFRVLNGYFRFCVVWLIILLHKLARECKWSMPTRFMSEPYKSEFNVQLHNVICLCRLGIVYLFYHFLAYDLNRSCTIAIITSNLSLHLSCVLFPYNFFVAIISLYVLLLIPC